MIILTVISILTITCAVWMVNKVFPFQVCPICAGVSGTWLWMLAASLLGYQIDLIIVAMLLGGSVVGIAYQLEKKLPVGRSPLLWKTLFIPTGFVAAYSLVASQWAVLVGSAGLAGILALVFLRRSGKQQVGSKVAAQSQLGEPRPMGREDLKKKMENCC